jgi:lactoylglutathione lyase
MLESTLAVKIHTIMLGTRDLDRSISFYTDTLGMTLQGRFGDFAFLDANGTSIALSAQLARTRPPLAPPPVEIVLAVPGVREAYDRLRGRGVTFLNEPHTVDGTNDVANFEDPDGHLFSIYGAP